MTGSALALAALLAAAPASAEPPPRDAVFAALADEMARTTAKLEMEGLGKPYYVSYTVEDSTSLYLWATFGALKDPHESRGRFLKVGLRVGSRAFDNAHYVSKDFWSYRPPVGRLPLDDDYGAIRFAAWTLTDQAYKAALQKFSQKRAYKKAKMIREEVPDLSEEPVWSGSDLRPEEPLDRALWEERLRRLSAAFRAYPVLQRSAANLFLTTRRVYFLDSEGRRTLKSEDEYQLVLEAAAQAHDGMELSDRRRVIRRRIAELPPMEELEAMARGLAEDVAALARAPQAEPYVGPVLLEGQAAGEFFNQLLARNVSAPRELWVEEERVKDRFLSGELASRIGLRVLSPDLSAVDDPTLESFEGAPLAGAYRIDDEGLPARPVRLVERGILKDLLMSRSPTKDRARSNGHGRAGLGEFPSGRPGNLVIEARRGLPAAELKAELLRQAREFGLGYGLIVRRLGEEDLQEEGERLARPVLVYKAYVEDGREELVRGAQFSGVSLRALRDISAASSERRVYDLNHLGPYKTGRGEVLASIVHPSVLVAEMELKKTEKKPEKLPYLGHPHFERR